MCGHGSVCAARVQYNAARPLLNFSKQGLGMRPSSGILLKVFDVKIIIIKLTVPLPNKLAINCRLYHTKISAFAISNITKCILICSQIWWENCL